MGGRLRLEWVAGLARNIHLDCYKAGERVEHYEKTGAFEQIFYKREIHEESLEHDLDR